MTTIQIELPEATAQAARAAGLLTPQALARALHVSLDQLVFDEDRRVIKALLDGMIVKHQTKQMVGNLRR